MGLGAALHYLIGTRSATVQQRLVASLWKDKRAGAMRDARENAALG